MTEFIIIACMRVVQAVCNKKVSTTVVNGKEVFAYGSFYQLMAAVLSFLYLCVIGFQGFNFETFLCAFGTAVFLAIGLLAELEAIKGAPIAVCTICSMGGLFVPCIAGIFLFGEPMGIVQWFALLLFLLGVYLLGSVKEKRERFTGKTILMLLFSFFSNGMVMVWQKYFAVMVPDGNVAMFSFLMFLSSAMFLIVCLIYQILVDKDEKVCRLPGKIYGYGMALAVALFLINYLVTELAGRMSSVTLYTISSFITIAISAIVGAVGFHEKITVKKLLGLCIGAIAIILANVG